MLVLFTVLMCFNMYFITKADDNNDYINELPSKERYAFVERVARRIIEEVDVKETPKKEEIVIPDAELDKPNEYVNKLMAEEVARLKTARKNYKKKAPQKKVTKTEDRPDKYISFTFRTHLQDDMKDHVDLTVARKKRSIYPKAINRLNEKKHSKLRKKRGVSEVPVKVVFDQSKGTKGNERRSWDQNDDDSEKGDEFSKTVEDKSGEYSDNDRTEKNVKTLEEETSEIKDSAPKNEGDEKDTQTLESSEPNVQKLNKEQVEKSSHESTNHTEDNNETISDKPMETSESRVKGIHAKPDTLTTEKEEQRWYTETSTTEDGDISTTMNTSNTETETVQFENSPLVVEFSNDTSTVEEVAETTTFQPGKESTESETTVPIFEETTTPMPSFQETVPPREENATFNVVTETVNQDPKTISFTNEQPEKTVYTTEEYDTTTPNNEESTTTEVTIEETATTESTTPKYVKKVSSTRELERSLPTKDGNETMTVSESTEPNNDEPSITVTPEPKVTDNTHKEFQEMAAKKVLRVGVISEESFGDNVAYRPDQLLRHGGKTETTPADEPIHLETLFKAMPKSTKKVRIVEQVPQDKEVLSKTHEHGIQYYRVYEVDPALNLFKLRTDVKGNQDQPHYAPVYNYEPESAFFSPQNRQGPNLREGDENDDQADFRQTGSSELRTNIDQQSYVPVYNYLPENAYYNPQNRLGPNDDNLEEDLYYKRAGVKAADKIQKAKDKVDEDYYYARNEAIQDSLESRKFRFRNIPAVGDTGKSAFKAQPLLKKRLVLSKFIYVTTQKAKYHQRNQQNSDYMDYNFMRKAGKKREKNRALKQRPQSQISEGLDEYFGKKKKARLGKIRQLSKQGFYEYKADKPADSKPISIDYYYGVNDPGSNMNVEGLIYKVNYKKEPQIYKDDHVTATEKPGFQHRAMENHAIDLDYYFDRKNFDGKDDDFPDFIDEDDLDKDRALFRKFHLRSGDSKTEEEKKYVKSEDVKKSTHKVLTPYTRVLKDMFEINSGVLVKYDWLGTTVSIRAALAKLADLIDAEEHGEVINAHDKEILKYLIKVYNDATRYSARRSTKDCVNLNLPKLVAEALRSRNVLPKNKRKKPGEHIKNPLKLVRDVYYHLMRSCTEDEEREKSTNTRTRQFKDFLDDLEDGLYDFHTAIKNIATVTKFDKQNWYQNIKDLYLSKPKANSKEPLEVLLHLVIMEVFERIEQSAKDGLEEDSDKYVSTHGEEFKETKKELMFVLRLLEEINKVDN